MRSFVQAPISSQTLPQSNTTRLRGDAVPGLHTLLCFPSRTSHVQGQKYLMSSEEEPGLPMENDQSKRNRLLETQGSKQPPHTLADGVYRGVHTTHANPYSARPLCNCKRAQQCSHPSQAALLQQVMKQYVGEMPPQGTRQLACHLYCAIIKKSPGTRFHFT